MTFPFPERVPYAAVERLLRNFAALRQTLEDALVSADPDNTQSRRLQKAAALLRQEHAALERERSGFETGKRDGLLQHAADLRLLARRMDGYSLSFAGDDAAAAMAQHRQLLVLTAWQITAAASGSEAAGL